MTELCAYGCALHGVRTPQLQDMLVKQAAKAEELQLLSAERMLLAIESIDQVSLQCRLGQACQACHQQGWPKTSIL